MKQNIGKILAIVLVVALCSVFFAACVPSDPEKAKANLKEAGYVLGSSNDILGMVGLKSSTYEDIITATNGEESVTILYFKEAKDAKAYWDKAKAEEKEFLEELKAKDEESYNKYKEEMKNYSRGRSGKVVWSGTKAGVKAAG